MTRIATFCLITTLSTFGDGATALGDGAGFEAEVCGRVGDRVDYLSEGSEIYQHKVFGSFDFKLDIERGANSAIPQNIEVGAKAFHFLEKPETYKDDSEIEPTALIASYPGSIVSAKLGLQEIPWGESFGVAVLDIVNPRDYRESILEDFSTTRLPVWAINSTIYSGSMEIQVIAALPRHSKYPYNLGGIEIYDERELDLSAIEYGSRVRKLFRSGTELSAYYYEHDSRLPVFNVDLVDNVPVFEAYNERVSTIGASFSRGEESFVFRGDGAFHKDRPLIGSTALSSAIRGDQLQFILGADYFFENGFNSGLQWHVDRLLEEPDYDTSGQTLQWVSGRVMHTIMSDSLDLSFFGYIGLGNDDVWFKPKATYHSRWNLDFDLWYDYIDGGDLGYLGNLEEFDRVVFQASVIL